MPLSPTACRSRSMSRATSAVLMCRAMTQLVVKALVGERAGIVEEGPVLRGSVREDRQVGEERVEIVLGVEAVDRGGPADTTRIEPTMSNRPSSPVGEVVAEPAEHQTDARTARAHRGSRRPSRCGSPGRRRGPAPAPPTSWRHRGRRSRAGRSPSAHSRRGSRRRTAPRQAPALAGAHSARPVPARMPSPRFPRAKRRNGSSTTAQGSQGRRASARRRAAGNLDGPERDEATLENRSPPGLPGSKTAKSLCYSTVAIVAASPGSLSVVRNASTISRPTSGEVRRRPSASTLASFHWRAPRGGGIGAERRPHAGHLVGRDRHARTGPAAHDAAIGGSCRDGLADAAGRHRATGRSPRGASPRGRPLRGWRPTHR